MKKPLFLALCGIIFIAACTKIATTNLGGGLIPPVDGITTFDTTFDVIAESYVDGAYDTARAYLSDNHVVGRLTDPLFGNTDAKIYFELKPNFVQFDTGKFARTRFYFPALKDSMTMDSVVLVLSYKGFYGDSSATLNLNVREINTPDSLKGNRAYPVQSQWNTPINTSFIASKNVSIPSLSSFIKTKEDSVNNTIRIPLPISFANRFKNYDSTPGNAYSGHSEFRKKFAGFELSTTSGNALISINPSEATTRLAFYYRITRNFVVDTVTTITSFLFNQFDDTNHIAASRQANFIKRDTTAGQFASFRPINNTGDSLLFVQTAPGTHVRLKIPGINSLSNRIIHRAELIATQVPFNTVTDLQQMLPPRYLLLSIYDTARKAKRNIPTDFYLDASNQPDISYFGGDVLRRIDPVFGDVAYYNFNISRYIQGIATRQDTSFAEFRITAPANDSVLYKATYPSVIYPLYTGVSYSPFAKYLFTQATANTNGFGRVRLAGGAGTTGGSSPNRSSIRMRLRVIYSKI